MRFAPGLSLTARLTHQRQSHRLRIPHVGIAERLIPFGIVTDARQSGFEVVRLLVGSVDNGTYL